jgi:serpin B
MSHPQGLFVTDVVQKASVEVNEDGSSAAAASFGMMANRMVPRAPPFVADRPFLFHVRDSLTGLVLFAGRLADPSKN